MAVSSTVPTIANVLPNDWNSVLRFSRDVQKYLNSLAKSDQVGLYSTLTLSDLTASRLVATDSSKTLESTDLNSWVTGTANEINITDDGDGTITIGIVDPLIVAKGGTGAATLIDHGLLVGSGTSAITALGVATDGQLPIGSTGADPVLATLTGTANQISVTNGAGSITLALTGNMDEISALVVTDGNFIVGNGSTWVAESGDTARTSLGVGTGDSPTFNDITISTPSNIYSLSHDSFADFDANEHFLQTAITNVSTALSTGLLKVTTGTGALSVITDSSTNWDAAYTHVSNNGTDHGYIDQDIQTTASPSFVGLTLSGALIQTPDEITATSEGTAASVSTVNTEVTTNGDSDLDNVTLANGTSGQVKCIYCVAEGNAADTWKITPATMLGGTQITFSGVGEGCILKYADNEGWIVVANNGGTIS